MSFRFACLLVVFRKEGECCRLEDGASNFFGVYGGREIIGALRTWRGLRGYFIILFSYFVSLDCSICFPVSISYDDFLVRFSPSS
jgi:hypothetical protein